jgi:hypothetical protein
VKSQHDRTPLRGHSSPSWRADAGSDGCWLRSRPWKADFSNPMARPLLETSLKDRAETGQERPIKISAQRQFGHWIVQACKPDGKCLLT